MSSLASQLQGIAQAHRALNDNIERKSRVPFGLKSLIPTILFTALEAADQSQAFVYELGLHALHGLATGNAWWQAVLNQKDSFLLFNNDLNRAQLVLYIFRLFLFSL